MKIPADYISKCINYLEVTKTVSKRNELVDHHTELLKSTTCFEVSDFNKVITLFKNYRLSDAIDELKDMKSEFEKTGCMYGRPLWDVYAFINSLNMIQGRSIYTKNIKIKDNFIQQEIEDLFPNFVECGEVAKFIYEIASTPYHRFSIMSRCDLLGLDNDTFSKVMKLV